MSLCPVCLADISATRDGHTVLPTVQAHMDGIGKLCPMSGQPMPEWVERSTRAAVKGRSGGICEHCLMQRATDMHHRISAGTGGWWSPANILHLCRLCHSRFTDNMSLAYQMGISLRRSQDPEEVPIMRANGEIFYVTDQVAA
jgi:5-methylcytosine-specific restriction protein A